MKPKALSTAEEIFHVLGGIGSVAELTGSKYTAAWNWRRTGSFPPRTFVLMRQELERRGYSAPAELWRMQSISA